MMHIYARQMTLAFLEFVSGTSKDEKLIQSQRKFLFEQSRDEFFILGGPEILKRSNEPILVQM